MNESKMSPVELEEMIERGRREIGDNFGSLDETTKFAGAIDSITEIIGNGVRAITRLAAYDPQTLESIMEKMIARVREEVEAVEREHQRRDEANRNGDSDTHTYSIRITEEDRRRERNE